MTLEEFQKLGDAFIKGVNLSIARTGIVDFASKKLFRDVTPYLPTRDETGLYFDLNNYVVEAARYLMWWQYLDQSTTIGYKIDECLQVMVNKSEEYMVGDERLYSFKRGAEIAQEFGVSRVSPELLAYCQGNKHFTSCEDIVLGRIPSNGKGYSLKDKFGDAVNYQLLQAALFEDTHHLSAF